MQQYDGICWIKEVGKLSRRGYLQTVSWYSERRCMTISQGHGCCANADRSMPLRDHTCVPSVWYSFWMSDHSWSTPWKQLLRSVCLWGYNDHNMMIAIQGLHNSVFTSSCNCRTCENQTTSLSTSMDHSIIDPPARTCDMISVETLAIEAPSQGNHSTSMGIHLASKMQGYKGDSS